jgi:peptidoglycan-associated lipoprotein
VTARKTLALAAVLAIGLAACSKKQEIADLPPPGGTQTASNSQVVTSNGPIAGSRADFLARMAGNEVIFFGFDKFDIDQEDAASLQAQAQWLMQYSNKRATIEGHADERGTREYNLALGERRANAAKNYLVSLGVSANRLNVVSYGKERPAASGSNEQAWAQNRRAVTVAVD